jgi:CHAT domain-containing protein
VAQAGDEPRYLLDVGPPIHYAPSATILLKLTPAADAPRARLAALTLGEPAYERAAGESRGAPAAARYALLGGSLESLPFSRRESDWIVGLLKDAGADVRQLVGGAANEAALRQQGPGRTLLHVACHGMVDQAHGNLFGALALSPGAPGSPPAQDGFLTLAELYELNLKGCELAVLSACETNCGPEQQGEGVWALSRGFLVAGARRVVASNWLVSDEAAASLVSYFCGGVAQAEKAGQPPDYAAALHASKRWVRQQPKWQSPFYWAPFVMIGPS